MSGGGGDASRERSGGNISAAMRRIEPLDEKTASSYIDNTVINSRYTAANFIPKNLYEQFRRPLNFYFLLVSALQFISAIAPVNPMSTLLPLLFAFTLTAVKEGYDDLKRHRQDDEANNRMLSVLVDANGFCGWVLTRSADVKVGNVILLNADDEIPADCVVIAAAGAGGGEASVTSCYMRTDNMDGETDLKPRDVINFSSSGQLPSGETLQAAVITPHSPPVAIAELARRLTLHCPPPHAAVDSFEARADVGSSSSPNPQHSHSLSHLHLLLQSCYLKKTAAVVAIVCYTGSETKCGLNKRPAPQKWAVVDQHVSNYSKIIFCFQVVVALVLGISGYNINRSIQETHWYLQPSPAEVNAAAAALIYPLRFFLLTTVMIPISFKFVVDMCKYYMSLVLEWDLAMYDDERGEGMRVRNSSIVEDLGQIQFVLSDKTGTMTENKMVLRFCSVGGNKISLADCPITLPDGDSNAQAVENFFTALALCNSVETQVEVDGSISYSAVSPDDEALCIGAAKFGTRLLSRTRDRVVIDVLSQTRVWKLLHVFSFSSERKSMGVIVQEQSASDNGDAKPIQLIVKGADDKVFSMLQAVREDIESSGLAEAAIGSKSTSLLPEDVDIVNKHLMQFAATGLRTLAVACKVLSAAEWETFQRAHAAALLETVERERHITVLREELERKLTLIGATAIEDRLQDGVTQTISDLAEANVKMWMLTGDKVETAQQIAISCGLFRFSDQITKLTAGSEWEATLLSLDERSVKVAPPTRPPSLVARSYCIPRDSDSDVSNDALIAGTGSKPAQDLVTYETAALGDGGTFLSMESQQPKTASVLLVQGGAVLDKILHSPDLLERFIPFAMKCKSVVCARVSPAQKAQIADLVRRQGFITLAIGDGGNDVAMIQEAHVGVGILGKEGQQASRAADFTVTRFRHLAHLMFVHGHLSYSRTCLIVKYSFYKSMLISFVQLVFNMQCTKLSGVSFWNSFALTMWNGCYTLPQTLLFALDRSAPRTVLEHNPVLYRQSQQGLDMSVWSFAECLLRGVLQSAACFWLTLYGANAPAKDGSSPSGDTNFTTGYTSLILLQVMTVCCESNSLTLLNVASIVGMPLFYMFVSWTYANIARLQFYGVFQETLSAQLILVSMAVAIALFLPRLIVQVALNIRSPSVKQVMRNDEVTRQIRRVKHLLKMSFMQTTSRFSVFARLLFLQVFISEAPSPDIVARAADSS